MTNSFSSLREPVNALKMCESILARNGLYGGAAKLRAMWEPLAAVITDDETEELFAKAANVKRRDSDVCIIDVPPHWIDSLRKMYPVEIDAEREAGES